MNIDEYKMNVKKEIDNKAISLILDSVSSLPVCKQVSRSVFTTRNIKRTQEHYYVLQFRPKSETTIFRNNEPEIIL